MRGDQPEMLTGQTGPTGPAVLTTWAAASTEALRISPTGGGQFLFYIFRTVFLDPSQGSGPLGLLPGNPTVIFIFWDRLPEGGSVSGVLPFSSHTLN